MSWFLTNLIGTLLLPPLDLLLLALLGLWLWHNRPLIARLLLTASVSLGGLGRFLIDGQAYRDYGQMAGGALLVAVLAVAVDLVFAGVQRLVVSPGLTPVRTTRRVARVRANPAPNPT